MIILKFLLLESQCFKYICLNQDQNQRFLSIKIFSTFFSLVIHVIINEKIHVTLLCITVWTTFGGWMQILKFISLIRLKNWRIFFYSASSILHFVLTEAMYYIIRLLSLWCLSWLHMGYRMTSIPTQNVWYFFINWSDFRSW